MERIKVMLVDDHTLFRAGVTMLLQMESDMQVVGEASDGHLALELILKCRPDVVVLDISMPGLDGISVARSVLDRLPNAKLLMVTQHENREYILRATKVGVAGYLLKSAAADELVTAIRAVHSGRKYLDATVTQVLMDAWQAGEQGEESLTDRETEVLILTAQGKTMKIIAELLNISPKTVEFHRARLTQKLGLKNKSELVAYAIKQGLV
ncbi:response regulator transcription factor [Desulfosporosinus sp. BICA1-9]|uniref:response regulator n=1 Tax=Desulfosporosinus sp. BICA1-9 TaxID=1531958 RepID=UPI00054C04F6|nr:response regulator transcription factor [Desulfosporosinus sp. BICA1-9]KJS45976.1 MAG: regulator [Peptococcaceae bacterium BRH_c23]KJS80934.1 MAG: regulator [Desulfosporosinus sp. BICA1-9]